MQKGLLTCQEYVICSWINTILESKRTIIRLNLSGKALLFHPDAGYITNSTEENIVENIQTNKNNITTSKTLKEK